MNYLQQQRLFRRYRIIAIGGALLVSLSSWLLLAFDGGLSMGGRITLAVVVAGIGGLVYYLPLYLGLTVEADKRLRWAIKFRWIICGVVILLGTPYAVGAVGQRRTVVVVTALTATVVIIAAVNMCIREARRRKAQAGDTEAAARGSLFVRHAAWFYLAVDLLLIYAWAWWISIDTSVDASSATNAVAVSFVAVLLQVAIVFYIGTSEASQRMNERKQHRRTAGVIVVVCVAGTIAALPFTDDRLLLALSFAPLLLCASTTHFLVAFVAEWNVALISQATAEIARFTNTTTADAQTRLNEASSLLAANWRREQPQTPVEVTAWYQRNSGLYIYDLTGFHLYGKHIRFTVDLINLASGRVLDYGAGTGDLTLELARRGHPAVYFDVDGETRRFAAWRAEQHQRQAGTPGIEIYTERGQIRGCFDTIYSLDVLEHLPDPADALDFFIRRLSPGGRLIITAPFGSTDAHPMHFSHRLNAHDFLRARGLREAKGALRWFGSAMMRRKHVLVYEKRGQDGDAPPTG